MQTRNVPIHLQLDGNKQRSIVAARIDQLMCFIPQADISWHSMERSAFLRIWRLDCELIERYVMRTLFIVLWRADLAAEFSQTLDTMDGILRLFVFEAFQFVNVQTLVVCF